MDLYKAEDEKEQAGRKMTDSIYFEGTDGITIDEGFKFANVDDVSRDVSPEDNNLHGAKEGRRGEETRRERSHATMRLYACA